MYTTDPLALGSYDLMVVASYAEVPHYTVSAAFTLDVLTECINNLITADPINDGFYDITAQAKVLAIKPSSISMSQCGPVTYSATLATGASLPSFIKFDSSHMTITVQSS